MTAEEEGEVTAEADVKTGETDVLAEVIKKRNMDLCQHECRLRKSFFNSIIMLLY